MNDQLTILLGQAEAGVPLRAKLLQMVEKSKS